MRIVSRYLLAEFARSSVTVFLGLAVTWLAADTLLHIERLAGDRGEAARAILASTLEFIPLGVPMACLAGVVWSLTRAVKHREITAVRCGGIRLQRVLVPILIASLLAGLGLAVFEDRVLVPMRQALRQAEIEASDGPAAHVQHGLGRYWYASETSLFSAGGYRRGTGTLMDVTVFLLDDQHRIIERIEADTARALQGGQWEFRDARVLRFSPDGGLERRRALALRIDLGIGSEEIAYAQKPAEAATLHKLARAVRDHSGDPERRASLQVAFHGRLAHALAVLVLVLLAIPLAIGDIERGDSLARSMLLALVCALAYWTAWTTALLTGTGGYVFPPLAVWSVPVIGLAFGAWRFRALKE